MLKIVNHQTLLDGQAQSAHLRIPRSVARAVPVGTVFYPAELTEEGILFRGDPEAPTEPKVPDLPSWIK